MGCAGGGGREHGHDLADLLRAAHRLRPGTRRPLAGQASLNPRTPTLKPSQRTDNLAPPCSNPEFKTPQRCGSFEPEPLRVCMCVCVRLLTVGSCARSGAAAGYAPRRRRLLRPPRPDCTRLVGAWCVQVVSQRNDRSLGCWAAGYLIFLPVSKPADLPDDVMVPPEPLVEPLMDSERNEL
eukprot:3938463-Rhodomonas_salina.1